MKHNALPHLCKAVSGFLAALSLLSCGMEDEPAMEAGTKEFSFTAYRPDDFTKTLRKDDGSLAWSDFDAISVLNGNGNYRFSTGKVNQSPTAVFTGHMVPTDAYGGEVYAVYPYKSSNSVDMEREIIHTELDAHQTAVAGTFQDDLLPMVAKSGDSSLHFFHICGGLKFTLSSDDIVSVTFEGTRRERIAGAVDVYCFFQDEAPDRIKTVNSNLESSQVTLCRANNEPLEAGKDYYIVLLPGVLEDGFKMTFEKQDGTVGVLQVPSRVEVKRAVFGVIRNVDGKVIDWVSEEKERQALVALYQATGGDSWYDNKNWCSDEPLWNWYGVRMKDGHVSSINMGWNNICGPIPPEIGDLVCLESLAFNTNSITSVPPELSKCRHLNTLILSNNPGLGALPFSVSCFPELDLFWMSNTGLTSMPEGIYDCAALTNVELGENKITELSPDIRKLTRLDRLFLNDNQLSSVPDELYQCSTLRFLDLTNNRLTGSISPLVANLSNLKLFSVSGNLLTGNLPAELTRLDLDHFYFDRNQLSGKVPSDYLYWDTWQRGFWGSAVELSGNHLDVFGTVKRPDIQVTLLDGSPFLSGDLADKELTVFMQTATWCYWSKQLIPRLKWAYDTYKDRGLEILGWFLEGMEGRETIDNYLSREGIDWKVFGYDDQTNSIITPQWYAYEDGVNMMYGLQSYPITDRNRSFSSPELEIFDRDGMLVYTRQADELDKPDKFIANWFGDDDSYDGHNFYESSDYSRDGNIISVQTSIQGWGVKLVVMGDGYSDRMVADGTYRQDMNKAIDAFFSEEPYSSFRHLFDVWIVETVSRNEDYFDGSQTALNCWFKEGSTMVGGDDSKVEQYAAPALSSGDLQDVLYLVVVNSPNYAGTCYMAFVPDGDYGRGPAIAYCPKGVDSNVFVQTVTHEAGGHGFAKLCDEYWYEGTAVPSDYIASHRAEFPYGWWKNIDFTPDAASVQWSRFITDQRYAGEHIGVYEGAGTYESGAWRPTDYSIMRENTGGYNAPSRYAIWYRIHKLAYGADWNGTYEDFVEYDAVNRTYAATARRRKQAREAAKHPLPPLPPPVVHR